MYIKLYQLLSSNKGTVLGMSCIVGFIGKVKRLENIGKMPMVTTLDFEQLPSPSMFISRKFFFFHSSIMA